MDISSKIYLINREEIEFSAEYQHIKCLKTENKIELPPLETKVLVVLCQNANRYVSNEQLFELCWSTEVEDGSISRVISLLRKHFRELGAKAHIINKPKCGYMLQSHIQILEEVKKSENLTEETLLIIDESKLTLKAGKFALFTLLPISGVIFWFVSALVSFATNHPVTFHEATYKVENITPAFDDEENVQYQHLSISPSGNQIIYSKSNILDEKWELEWKGLASLHIQSLSKYRKNLTSPVWRDESSFAYHLYTENECEIRLVSLVNNEVAEDVLLHRCNAETLAKSLAWKDHEHLLFTDSNSIKSPHQLFELDVNTLMISTLKVSEKYGRGIYGVYSNGKRDKIALLTNHDWESTDIEIYEMGNYKERLDVFSVERPLFSVGWLDDSSVVFQNEFGGLSVYQTAERRKSTLSIAFDGYQSNPVAGGGKLAVLNGAYYVSNLY